MGNRAVIRTEKNDIGIYLHWNGGKDSVEGFIRYCKLKGYRLPEIDNYGWSRLSQVIGNFFGGSTSVGLGLIKDLDCDNYDNGVFIIKDWEIIGREFFSGSEQQEYDLLDVLEAIDEKQPEQEQIGKDEICLLMKK